MTSNKEHYLGDGLYAEWQGYQYKLRAPRDYVDHWVGLEPIILRNFFEFVKESQPDMFGTIMRGLGYDKVPEHERF